MICGNCAIGSPVIATTPSSTVRMAMTIATMGRSMKKRAIALLPRRRGWRRRRGGVAGGRGRRLRRRLDRFDHGAGLGAREPPDPHPLAGPEAAVDDPHGAH